MKNILVIVLGVLMFQACKTVQPSVATPLAIGNMVDGGIVFWIDESGKHGLVCSKEDLADGKNVSWDEAMKVSSNFNTGVTKSGEWQLPTSDELTKLLQCKKLQEYGLSTEYWSKTEKDQKFAKKGKLVGKIPLIFNASKTEKGFVRAVKSF